MPIQIGLRVRVMWMFLDCISSLSFKYPFYVIEDFTIIRDRYRFAIVRPLSSHPPSSSVGSCPKKETQKNWWKEEKGEKSSTTTASINLWISCGCLWMSESMWRWGQTVSLKAAYMWVLCIAALKVAGAIYDKAATEFYCTCCYWYRWISSRHRIESIWSIYFG